MKTVINKNNKIFFAILIFIVVIVNQALGKLEDKTQKIDRIILFTIDTTRADHVSAYGYPIKTTPFFDHLAKEGILAKKALSHISTTVPSHATIFTSLYPHQVNVLSNFYPLNDHYITLAEMLSNLGYETAAFVSTNQFISNNFTQGFDIFEEDKEPSSNPRRGDLTLNEALQWLRRKTKDDKFFTWVHLYDPHRPYEPPPEFGNTIKKQTKKSHLKYLKKKQMIEYGFYADNPDNLLDLVSSYDGELLFDDTLVKIFYNTYTSQGLNENTLWIIASDHGEGLGNHKWPYHGKFIYNEQLLVPLLFHFSSGLYKGRKIDKLVELVDILPTIIDLAGGDIKKLNTEYPIVGKSLVPLFKNKHADFPDRLVPAYRKKYSTTLMPDIIDETANYEYGYRYSIQDQKYKYIYYTHDIDEFYDLKKDPYETKNLIKDKNKQKDSFKQYIINLFDLDDSLNKE